ncbi:MAG: His/Gly/Thr/Pro-type tRNA ligase C-terminal domain-containing protein, partial [Candidatus Micrarchaeaceae archaeon]
YATVFVAHVSNDDFDYALAIANRLRSSGLNTDLDLSQRSLSKQLAYASSLGIPYAIIIGAVERKQGKLKLRDMSTGAEELLGVDEAINKINKSKGV